MDKQSMYTAQELTDEQIESIAESLEHDAENLYGDNTKSFMDDENNAAAALRDYVRLRKENAQLKVRLEAVVKECEKMRDDFSKRMRSFTGMFAQNMRNIYVDKIKIVDDILCTAHGEGSVPQQA